MKPIVPILLMSLALLGTTIRATAATIEAPREVIVDTDIGDDIDDVFALALVLSSPEFRVDGITTSFGDTGLRAREVERLLRIAGRRTIPVAAGPRTPPGTAFTQADWAKAEPEPRSPFPDAVDFTLDRLRAAPPGRITLIALAPLTTVGAMIDRDPIAFRRLGGVVMMGGSIRHGYGVHAGENSSEPSIEYNIRSDPAGFAKLLGSGVPIEMMPLDATEVALGEAGRKRLFAGRSPLSEALSELYSQWASHNSWGVTPTLFDVVPVARLLRPSVCTPVPLRIAVSNAGSTTVVGGAPNVSACLDVDHAAVLDLLQDRLRPK